MNMYIKYLRSTYVLMMISALILFISISATVFAHGSGASVETTVDGHFIDIGLSEEQFVAGELSRFDFALMDEATGEDVTFSDVWLRINQENKVYLATGVHRPELGQTGISYVFPSPGEYQVNVRYQNEGDAIVEHTFPVTVLQGAQDGTSGSDVDATILIGALVGIAVVGIAVGYGIGSKRTKKQTSWQETESQSL